MLVIYPRKDDGGFLAAVDSRAIFWLTKVTTSCCCQTIGTFRCLMFRNQRNQFGRDVTMIHGLSEETECACLDAVSGHHFGVRQVWKLFPDPPIEPVRCVRNQLCPVVLPVVETPDDLAREAQVVLQNDAGVGAEGSCARRLCLVGPVDHELGRT